MATSHFYKGKDKEQDQRRMWYKNLLAERVVSGHWKMVFSWKLFLVFCKSTLLVCAEL